MNDRLKAMVAGLLDGTLTATPRKPWGEVENFEHYVVDLSDGTTVTIYKRYGGWCYTDNVSFPDGETLDYPDANFESWDRYDDLVQALGIDPDEETRFWEGMDKVQRGIAGRTFNTVTELVEEMIKARDR